MSAVTATHLRNGALIKLGQVFEICSFYNRLMLDILTSNELFNFLVTRPKEQEVDFLPTNLLVLDLSFRLNLFIQNNMS